MTKQYDNLKSLLNPENEKIMGLDEGPNQEIFQAVMDAHGAERNLEINGGDNVDEDDGIS